MVALHGVLHFAIRLGIAVVVALLVALGYALVYHGPFHHGLEVGFYGVGAVALFLGALGLGGMSPSSGVLETSGRLPNMRAWTQVALPPNPLSVQAILFLTAATLIGVGVLFQLF